MRGNLLTISKEEWDEAEEFFKQDPKAVKFRRSARLKELEEKGENVDWEKRENTFSFIKVGENEIYAISNRDCYDPEDSSKSINIIGKGAFKKVKLAQNRKGKNYALAISTIEMEGQAIDKENQMEIDIAEELGIYKNKAIVDKKIMEDGKEKKIKRLHVVMEYFDVNLFKEYIKTNRIEHAPKSEKLWLALKMCRAIQSLHRKSIIHSDIKVENFMGSKEGHQIVVCATDFGTSDKLKEGQKAIILPERKGSTKFMAPEIADSLNHAIYSTASDVYSLGVILKDYLKLDEHLYEKMTARYLRKEDCDKIAESFPEHFTDEDKFLIELFIGAENVPEEDKRISLDLAIENLLNELKDTLYPTSETSPIDFPFAWDKQESIEEKDEAITAFIRHAEFCNKAIATIEQTSDPTQDILIDLKDDTQSEIFTELTILMKNRYLEHELTDDNFLIIPPETFKALRGELPKQLVEEVAKTVELVLEMYDMLKQGSYEESGEYKIKIGEGQFNNIVRVAGYGVNLRYEKGHLILNDNDRNELEKIAPVKNLSSPLESTTIPSATLPTSLPSAEPLPESLEMLMLIYEGLNETNQDDEYKIKIVKGIEERESLREQGGVSLTESEFAEMNTMLASCRKDLALERETGKEGDYFTIKGEVRTLLEDIQSGFTLEEWKMLNGGEWAELLSESPIESEHLSEDILLMLKEIGDEEEIERILNEGKEPKEITADAFSQLELEMLHAPFHLPSLPLPPLPTLPTSPVEVLETLLLIYDVLKGSDPGKNEYKIKIAENIENRLQLKKVEVDIIKGYLNLPQKDGYLIMNNDARETIVNQLEILKKIKQQMQSALEALNPRREFDFSESIVVSSLKGLDSIYSIEARAEALFKNKNEFAYDPEQDRNTVEELITKIEDSPLAQEVKEFKFDFDFLEEIEEIKEEAVAHPKEIETQPENKAEENIAPSVKNSEQEAKNPIKEEKVDPKYMKKRTKRERDIVEHIQNKLNPPAPVFPEIENKKGGSVADILKEYIDEKVLHKQYKKENTLLFHEINVLAGTAAEQRWEQISDINTIISQLRKDSTLNSHEKGVVLYGTLEKIKQEINEEIKKGPFKSRLGRICSRLQNRLVEAGVSKLEDVEFSIKLSKKYAKSGAEEFRNYYTQQTLKTEQPPKDHPEM